MKHAITIFLLLAFCVTSKAQKWEVGGGVGYLTAYNFFTSLTMAGGTGTFLPGIHFDAAYYLSPAVFLLGSYTVEQGESVLIHGPLVGIGWRYLHKKYVALSSSVQYGFVVGNLKEQGLSNTALGHNFHADLIKLRVGQKVGGTLALGLGTKGFVHLGINVRL